MKIKLYEPINAPLVDNYYLNPLEKYTINMKKEISYQLNILMSFQILGAPPALKNYHAWLFENGFNENNPNPTNEIVSQYYGIKPLWKTDYSLGIVVKDELDDDFYIVMECSAKNKGFRHTMIILTLGGCV